MRRMLLFDVDGTLVHVGGAGRDALAAAFGEVFLVADPVALMAPIRFDGNTDLRILSEAVHRAGLDPADFAARREEFDASYVRQLQGRVSQAGRGRVLPGVVELLELAVDRGHALGLMTGNTEAGARAKLGPFGLNRFFPTGAFGGDHEDRRELAALARRRVEAWTTTRFAAGSVTLFGDSVMDVRSGKAHGFRTVAVLTGWTAREALAAERPDHLLNDLRELLPSGALG